MSNHLNNIPGKQDQQQFLEKLQEFHQARGTHLGRIPTFGGQVLDLHALYNIVTSFGGISIVTERKKWDQVFTALGFPPCLNAAYALRQHYCRYLEAYEKIYFFGEETEGSPSDPNRMAFPRVSRYKRMNGLPLITSVGEPLVQNFNRIMFSLQSGYPNEVDFALNICSLLSNVTNSIFNLAKCPQILSLILGHVGVWCQDGSFVEKLCEDWHGRKKNYHDFWTKSVEDQTALKVYNAGSLGHLYKDEAAEELFSLFNTIENKKFENNNTPECSRITQVLVILYNFSFETLNSLFISSHDAAKRFLILAGCCKQNLIQRTALDTLDNIAEHVTIGRREDPFNQQFLQVLHNFFMSSNKFKRLRGQSILAKLASTEDNKDILIELLSKDVYKRLIETLYLPDISLVLHALDTLYYLSALSRETSDGIVNVHGSISVLIALSTTRAESYGNQAIEGYRIIENKLSIFSPKNQHWLKQQQAQQQARQQVQHRPLQPHHPGMPPQNLPHHIRGPSPLRTPTPQYSHPPVGPLGVPQFPGSPSKQQPKMPPPNNAPRPPVHGSDGGGGEDIVELEDDVFTAHWMSGFYEPNKVVRLKAASIYNDYKNTCTELKRSSPLSKEDFLAAIRTILPPDLVSFEMIDDDHILHGIQRRNPTMQVHSRIPRIIYRQLVTTGQLKPKTHPIPSDIPKYNPAINPANPGPSQDQKASTMNLNTADECRAMLERLKKDIQGHFMNFHTQREYIQSFQSDASKSQMPPHLMKDFQIRMQGHYQQMQMHFQKLQQLNTISEEVNRKLKSLEETKQPSSVRLNGSSVNCQPVIVPPPAPLQDVQSINIQHEIPNESSSKGLNSSVKQQSNAIQTNGRLSGEKQKVTSNGHESPRKFDEADISVASPNTMDPAKPKVSTESVTLSNPFGQFPHAEALKTLYKNNLKSRALSNSDLSQCETVKGLTNGNSNGDVTCDTNCEDTPFEKLTFNGNHSPTGKENGVLLNGNCEDSSEEQSNCDSNDTISNGKSKEIESRKRKVSENSLDFEGKKEKGDFVEEKEDEKSHDAIDPKNQMEATSIEEKTNNIQNNDRYIGSAEINTSTSPTDDGTPKDPPNEKPKTTQPELMAEGFKTFWQLNGMNQLNGVYPCLWDRCSSQPFESSSNLLTHMIDSHAPLEGKMSRCKVKGCSSNHKPRGILISHFQEKHCLCVDPNQVEKSKDFQIHEESPVTRSIRYTSTLILRNLARNSTYGRQFLSKYESHIAQVAMSSSEATLAAVDSLFEFNNQSILKDDIDLYESDEETIIMASS
eukprot:TCONS_00027865-protein